MYCMLYASFKFRTVPQNVTTTLSLMHRCLILSWASCCDRRKPLGAVQSTGKRNCQWNHSSWGQLHEHSGGFHWIEPEFRMILPIDLRKKMAHIQVYKPSCRRETRISHRNGKNASISVWSDRWLISPARCPLMATPMEPHGSHFFTCWRHGDLRRYLLCDQNQKSFQLCTVLWVSTLSRINQTLPETVGAHKHSAYTPSIPGESWFLWTYSFQKHSAIYNHLVVIKNAWPSFSSKVIDP